MAKVIIEFDSFEDADELRDALRAQDYKSALDAIWEELFRPNHKHGYKDGEINQLLGLNDEVETPITEATQKLLEKLQLLYSSIMKGLE